MAEIILLDIDLEALTRNATNADGIERSIADIVKVIEEWACNVGLTGCGCASR